MAHTSATPLVDHTFLVQPGGVTDTILVGSPAWFAWLADATSFAQGLIGVMQAVRLLGTEVLLVGIRPEVAQTIVGLGLDLRGVRTYSDIQSALDCDERSLVGQMPTPR